jgi:hypothetical protein
MLTCTPRSIFSWNYRVSGLASGPATLTFGAFSEQGGISLGGEALVVRKQGLVDAHWILECDGNVRAIASKPSMLLRAFDLVCGDEEFIVKAQSPVTRSYDILAGDSAAGTIEPAHPFTRKAYIKCGPAVSEAAQLFSFWLAALTWRRAASTSGT